MTNKLTGAVVFGIGAFCAVLLVSDGKCGAAAVAAGAFGYVSGILLSGDRQ